MGRHEGSYSHGLVPEKELRKDVIKAVAGVVVSKDGRLLVGTEKIDKASTRKKAGDISIPFETLKPKELKTEGGFVSALLTEITSDQSIEHLYEKMDSAGVIDQVEVMPGVWVATLLLRYNGDSSVMPFESQNPDEFGDLQWMGVKTLLATPNRRPFVDTVLDRVLSINRTRPNGVDFRGLNLRPYYPSVYSGYRDLEQDVPVGLTDAINALVTMEPPEGLYDQ